MTRKAKKRFTRSFGMGWPVAFGAFIALIVSFVGTNGGTFVNASVNKQTAYESGGQFVTAIRNANPITAQGGGGVILLDDSVLVAQVGPTGSIADSTSRAVSDQINIYVVREGDTVGQIARMFNVTTNTIRWANDIQGDAIRIGQTLTILPVTGVRHEVVKGDTLQSIAKKYKGDLTEISNYNRVSIDTTLTVGSIVTVPDGEIESPKQNTSTPKRPFVARALPTSNGYYIRPLVGGRRSQGLHGYNAIDFSADSGSQILSSAEGTVLIAKNYGWNGGYGNYVVIKHDNGTQTLYAHASEIIVYQGQHVVQGQVIAYVGNTGKSTGSHVHFEIRGAQNPF